MSKACTTLQPSSANGAFDKCGNIVPLNMQTPTTAQLRIAIEALTKLGERLNIEAAYSIAQLPETQLGNYYAGNIGGKTLEQTTCIETVTAQLKNWHDELSEQRRSVFAKAGIKTMLHDLPDKRMAADKKTSDDKNAVKNKWSEIKKRFKKSCHEVKDSFQQPSLGSSLS